MRRNAGQRHRHQAGLTADDEWECEQAQAEVEYFDENYLEGGQSPALRLHFGGRRRFRTHAGWRRAFLVAE